MKKKSRGLQLLIDVSNVEQKGGMTMRFLKSSFEDAILISALEENQKHKTQCHMK
jgi:hypothetical protein